MTKRRRRARSPPLLLHWFALCSLLLIGQLNGHVAEQSSPMLLYSTQTDIRIANTSSPGKNIPIVKSLNQGSAVDFYYAGNLICWSDQGLELIQCAQFNGNNTGEKVRIVWENIISPSGIAIDWYTEKIYWTDGDANRVEVTTLDGRWRKVLFWSDIDLARAIALLPMKGLLFWTDWGEVPKIERAGMNGDPKTRKVIVKDNIYWPNGLTIDYETETIYWLDAKLKFIDSIDLDGNNRKRIVKGGLVYAFALTLFSEKLYWTDWKTWSIHSWDISTDGPIRNLMASNPVPMDIRSYDVSRQPPSAIPHPCRTLNGNCSHLCLLSPDPPGFSCACPTGVQLLEGSSSRCADGPQTLLLVAQRSSVARISLDTPDYTPYTIPLRGVKRAITVDFDPNTQFMYWADNVAKSISRARLDGSEQEAVVAGGASGGGCVPDSIAIDSIAGNLYWTDPVADTITVARLDGSSRKVIVYTELYEPRAIALHPTAGWMFWSDWNEKRPKIERASLDGSERRLLVSDKLAWPNGIALDTKANKLYWGDARTHKIEVCNMDGTERRELHDKEILHIFGLTMLGNYLYWSDIQRRTLDRINRETGSEREPIVEQLANMMGLKAVEMKTQLGRNPCVTNNGNCSHLCFNRPRDLICGCPLGLELGKDERSCVQPGAYLVYACWNIVGHISIENPSDHNDAVLPLKDVKEVTALAVHVSQAKVYWADGRSRSVYRCSVNGTNIERVVEWAGLVEGLAVDWAGQNLYWTESAAQRVEAARLDGSSRRTLVWQGLRKPKSIVLDPHRGNMYWSELGSKCIKRAGMDGSAVTVILEQVGRVNSLTIDYEKRLLYWTTLDPPGIEFADLDGGNRKKLITDNIPTPHTLTLFQDHIYWGDWTTGNIEAANKLDGSGRQKIHSNINNITELAVWHKSRQVGENQCSVDNGGCSHLCLAVAQLESRCSCPTHFRLLADNTTCSSPDEFLIYATKNSVTRLLPGGSGADSPDAAVPLTGLKNVRAIDYDPVNKHLYWMDDDSHTIRRVPIGSSPTSAPADGVVVVSGLGRPFHLALDVLGRAVYWSCADRDSINATSIDGNSTAGVIVGGQGMMPRHLALHQINRLLVWTDVGLGGIMRANMDGSSRKELAKVANATALAIDQTTGVVYWAVSRQIHAIDLHGSNKRVVWQGGWALSLAAYGGALYWAAGGGGGQRPLMRASLARRDAPAEPVPHTTRVAALVSVHPVERWHPCYGGAACGGAAGACLAEGTCGCGVGCARAPPPCPPGHFSCDLSRHSAAATGTAPQCVPLAWKCDGQVDCPDGSDEVECGECGRGVRCADGACAESLSACDAGAPCEPGDFPDAFRCGGGRVCLAARLLCDRRRQCDDGADEAPAACGYASRPPPHSAAFVAACVLAVGGAVGLLAWAGVRRRRAAEARRLERAPAGGERRVFPRKPAPSSQPSRRARPLGASGSDSGGERYPRETLNPPPSPATASGGRRRAYRHYRAMNRPPPPTPCSTDACESDYTTAGAAPPPTPCATEPPSSRSSTYFSPYPPPPSPAHHFSDS